VLKFDEVMAARSAAVYSPCELDGEGLGFRTGRICTPVSVPPISEALMNSVTVLLAPKVNAWVG
jgi:hypothetical protein